MVNKDCPDCHGTGRVKDTTGIHTCWKCLQEGEMEQHSRDVKDSGIRI